MATENLDELRKALTVVIESEWVGHESEQANRHSLQDFLVEIRDTIHEHQYSGERYDYGDGSYEVECIHCGNTIFIEA